VQCDLCGTHDGGQFFPLELPDATSCTLCRGCAGRMRGFAGASGDALARLTAAEQDLREAAALAPGHTVEKNLADVQRLRQALRDDPSAAGASAARPRWIRAAYVAGVALLLLYFFHDFGGRFAP
jgi:Flp pilus assembly protein TadB